MAADGAPIAVIQTQRMGDLILTYPLLLWLARRYPGHPVTVVAEPGFAAPLSPISPPVAYLPLSRGGELTGREHLAVINLSIRPEAAALAGAIAAARRLGPFTDAGGAVRVAGDWQLYRASVVHNNRHNRFHWAELNALDMIPLAEMAATRWAAPRQGGAGRRRVGVFVGASEHDKRPSRLFWAGLVRELARRGLVPVLLGGPGEVALGAEVARLSGLAVANLCGRLGLRELAVFGQELALLVTPDTGPMHLAAWTGLKTLNISVGPVNAYETGPYQPGHVVLRPRMSCRGCWGCIRSEPFCRQRLDPARVAYAAARLARGEGARLAGAAIPGYELFETGRDALGLYALHRLGAEPACDAREAVGRLWRAVFGWLFGVCDDAPARAAMAALRRDQPRLAGVLGRGLAGLGARLSRDARRGQVPDVRFAAAFAPCLRPLAGFFERVVQNADGERTARLRCLEHLERLAGLFSQA
ncbi:MAG: glycosyltransferase family 9 protein [Solidesulfovibrio sp. DCME]|uniref:glycosyltransferase family 9 protein n=1 Tax=Solidesulfovibrio sp. DCME TaxID=3447380 RepID=UPI003D099FCA